jgi:hypothetical protein
VKSRYDIPDDHNPADDTYGPRRRDTSCLICGTPMSVADTPETIGKPTCQSCFQRVMRREAQRMERAS